MIKQVYNSSGTNRTLPFITIKLILNQYHKGLLLSKLGQQIWHCLKFADNTAEEVLALC